MLTISRLYNTHSWRSASNRGAVFHAGRRLPIVGRVSMDSIIVDAGDAPLRAGDPVELIGPDITLDAAAAAAGTISYEILTSLGSRYERRYISNNAAGERA